MNTGKGAAEEKSATPLKEKKVFDLFIPRKHIIENILNYSKSLEVFKTPYGHIFVSNN